MLGYKKSKRPSKRLKDIVPEDVVVEASCSEAEESDVDMPLAAKQQRRVKKTVKRSDGWIWLESMTRGQKLGEGKLAEYKRESKCFALAVCGHILTGTR
jgi:hypothetical protein